MPPTTLDEVRARFGADRPKPKPRQEVSIALGRLKKGQCPKCGKPTFAKLRCSSCRFDADRAKDPEAVDVDEATLSLLDKDEGGMHEEQDLKMARIAIIAGNEIVAPPPQVDAKPDEPDDVDVPVEELPEDSDALLKQLEEKIQRDARVKSQARTIRQQVGGDGSGRFTIETIHTDNGPRRDAILQFGKHKGRAVSELILQSETARYLRWLLDDDFNPVLKEIIREHLGIPKPGGE